MSWPAGYARIERESVDSTMTEAARVAPRQAGPAWLLAHRQTAGRARHGRPWRDPEGNFAATLILPLQEPPARAALRSFGMAVALARSFVQCGASVDDVSLKWPNDVLLQGRKAAGILLESRVAPDGLCLLIGVGVNLRQAPDPQEVEPDAVRPIAFLEATGQPVATGAFLTVLAHHFARVEQQFTTYGFAPIRTAWLSHAARLGEMIRARHGTTQTHGTFRDVDMQGQLVIETAKGPVHIAAADVFF